MQKQNLQKIIENMKNSLGNQSSIIIKNINIGKEQPIKAFLIYINELSDKSLISREILNPLMIFVNENLSEKENIDDYLITTYISLSNTYVEYDFNKTVDTLKRGKAVLYTENSNGYIISDTSAAEHRNIEEPSNESSIKDSREGFVENSDINIGVLRRRIKDKNLVVENLIIGTRTQTDTSLVYISDIADESIVSQIRDRLKSINVDKITASGILEQYIEHEPYSIFPQYLSSQRVDRIISGIMEGRIAIILDGTPSVLLAPSTFFDFFQSVDDYYERTIISNFTRMLRLIAVFIVITLPSIYLTLVKFNSELIPIKFITPIIQSRTGIALTPFLEILSMEIMVEFLREGGLRLPSKIAQTLSVVGGIIIGDTAIKSKIVSPSTLLIVGATVVASFLIPNYDMSLSIRLIRFPMIIITNILGIFGIAIVWFFIITHLFSMNNYGVEYMTFYKGDMKDIFIRSPLWKMNKRPEIIPSKDKIKQTDFRKNWNDSNDKSNE